LIDRGLSLSKFSKKPDLFEGFLLSRLGKKRDSGAAGGRGPPPSHSLAHLNEAMLETTIHRLESWDFLELEEALGAWDHQYQQISPGAFFGRFLQTQNDMLGLYRNCWERAIRYRGAPKGTMMFAVTLRQTGDARWMGQRVAVDDMCVQRCGAEAEYLSAPLWDSVVLTIPEAELAQQIVDITDEDPGALLHTHGVVHLTPQLAAQVRQAALIYLDAAVRSVATPHAPSPLPQMAKSTVELMARVLMSAQPQRHAEFSLGRSRQLIHNAEDVCEQHPDQPLRIGQLCRELGVSERTLREAFYKLTDTNPLAFLKAQRLNRVYRELRNSDLSEMLVKQAAYSNGFYHLGHFCRDYKKLFCETPLETLRRD
jgi:AraC-like DNA-binding protein